MLGLRLNANDDDDDDDDGKVFYILIVMLSGGFIYQFESTGVNEFMDYKIIAF